MNCTLVKRLFIGLTIGFFIAGCTAKRIKVVYEKDGNSGYSEVGHKHKKGGTPPHAPAHGYRAKHQYRYYPSYSVYYDHGRKIYFLRLSIKPKCKIFRDRIDILLDLGICYFGRYNSLLDDPHKLFANGSCDKYGHIID
jgi:hypothetical protein